MGLALGVLGIRGFGVEFIVVGEAWDEWRLAGGQKVPWSSLTKLSSGNSFFKTTSLSFARRSQQRGMKIKKEFPSCSS